ncbi:MAG TPA: tryptophan 2,3-dioxygenase family protein [Candidatus Sulfotelmatobacter sp.]|jgi:aminocarboxymuconate-semialdehyde decarboxylase|nr:tryptophan 2,3-dioxygenase family protein [Candidatus Sulfotelmatobacter sp.]
MPVIDIHNHFFPRTWPDLAARYGTPNWPWIKHTDPGKAEIMVGDRFFRQIYSACWEPQVRLSEMDRDGVEMQIISATPVLFAYDRPAEHALDCARLFNDAALEMCAQGKGRLKSFCQVPLQDIDASCDELSRCMAAGHLGVQIGNHVGDKNLDDPGIVTFLHHCADQGAAVLVHPWEMFGAQRMPKYMMPWTVAMPAETQLGIVAMILSGAFDKLPATLRICFAHGGGSFAFLLGRLENAWQHHPVAHGVCELPPSRYVNRFFVDSAVFDARALRFLVETMGAGNVMLGSDYPFPLGEERVGVLIRSSELPDHEKAQLLGGNAMKFLGLEGSSSASANDTENATRLKGENVSVVRNQLTYSSYLKVPELLQLQHPQSSPQHHDELLFIIVHQTYELWFKELLHDLDAVVANLHAAGTNPNSRDEIYEAARLLRRCTEITRVLVEQFTILETMLPTHFLAFRGKLEPASGFQSEQFRELEFLCGLKDEKMLSYHKPTVEAHALLERRLREPSLHDVFFEALQAMGKLQSSETASERERFEARARAILSLYRDERSNRDWIDVCERLTEFDELVVSWRLRHIQLVERVIGARMGTGGSAGSSYLKHTLDKKFFPELWEARTLLTE